MLFLVIYKRRNRLNCCRGGYVVCVFALAVRQIVSHAYGQLERNALYRQANLSGSSPGFLIVKLPFPWGQSQFETRC
jgi:hypothetical protein